MERSLLFSAQYSLYRMFIQSKVFIKTMSNEFRILFKYIIYTQKTRNYDYFINTRPLYTVKKYNISNIKATSKNYTILQSFIYYKSLL